MVAIGGLSAWLWSMAAWGLGRGLAGVVALVGNVMGFGPDGGNWVGCLFGVGGRSLVGSGRRLVLVSMIRVRSCELRGGLWIASAQAASCKVFTSVIVTFSLS